MASNTQKIRLIWPIIFLAPTVLGVIGFRLVPIFWSFGLSFFDWQIFDTPRFVGFDNYSYIFSSSITSQILLNTAWFAIMYVPSVISLALLLATILNSKIYGMAFFRGAFFLPYITTTVAITLVWRWIFSTRFGLLNNALDWFGIEQNIAWLSDPPFALPAVALVAVWRDAGFFMLLLLAGLQTIDPTYYEAAKIDGANLWQRFRNITIPLLSRSLFFVLIIAIIRSTQTFEITYALTSGGPNGASTTLAFAIYQEAFSNFNMGLAAALSYVLCVLLGFLTLLNFHLRKHWVHE